MAKKNKSKHASAARKVVLVTVIVGVSVVVFGWVWWARSYNKPQKAFEDMLDISLRTPGVTRHITEKNGQGAVDQTTRVTLQGQSNARTTTILTQETGNGASTVVTETLGTAQNDYVRYQAIDTNQTKMNGQPMDFKSILGLWGKGGSPADTTQPPARLLNESLFGVVPFAELGRGARANLLKTMKTKDVYHVDYGKVANRSENGRPVFVYSVSINPASYIDMLKQFARELGSHQLDGVNSSQFTGRPARVLEFSVDKLSHQLVRVHYVSSNRDETYSGYGLVEALNIPKNTISITELQNRLQQLQ